ncbi:hypothetical protein AB0I82_13915 [Streptomyces sp. NPDC050315]|uniref:hypothetical protein n=1 Tax=Streptomyces sp. NPDC050315 TaxID=3155039 RepID=UPI0034335AE2
MAAITKIRAHVMTTNVAQAASGAWVYLGIGGREFLLDIQGADLTQGGDDEYFFGEDANVENAEYNDPRTPPLSTEDVAAFPVYLRFESAGSAAGWCLEWVSVTANPGTHDAQRFVHPSLREITEKNRIWLDNSYGKAVYLRPEDERTETPTPRAL